MQRHSYETLHIHPGGLVSGVYYVNLPVIADNLNASGWIDLAYPTRSMPAGIRRLRELFPGTFRPGVTTDPYRLQHAAIPAPGTADRSSSIPPRPHPHDRAEAARIEQRSLDQDPAD